VDGRRSFVAALLRMTACWGVGALIERPRAVSDRPYRVRMDWWADVVIGPYGVDGIGRAIGDRPYRVRMDWWADVVIGPYGVDGIGRAIGDRPYGLRRIGGGLGVWNSGGLLFGAKVV